MSATAFARAKSFIPFLVLLLLGIGVYANSFQGVFLFDDIGQIVENKRIHSLALPWTFLQDTRRPLLYFILAVNYALCETTVWPYHLFNLAVHISAAVLLFLILRATFRLPETTPGLRSEAGPLALLISALWLVHPLQTQSVTYIIQRVESLSALFYLLTVYSSLRFMLNKNKIWTLAAVFSFLLGALTKETVATAPLLILLYDRTFFSLSFKKAFKNHQDLYLGLCLPWAVMLLMMVSTPQPPAAGFAHTGITPIQYALTQTQVIPHYIRLAVWPQPLVFSYLWEPVRSFTQVVPNLFLITSLLAACLWAWPRFPKLAFLGFSFFVLLSPTSSFIPLRDPAFEYRMYLPLACLLVLLVLAVRQIIYRATSDTRTRRWLAAALTFSLISLLSSLTIQRNLDYRDEVTIWEQTVAQRPNNFQAITDLAMFKGRRGQRAEAERLYDRALTLNPDYPVLQLNYGSFLVEQGKIDEGIAHYQRALALQPGYPEAHANLGLMLFNKKIYAEANLHLKQALTSGLDDPVIRDRLEQIKRDR